MWRGLYGADERQGFNRSCRRLPCSQPRLGGNGTGSPPSLSAGRRPATQRADRREGQAELVGERENVGRAVAAAPRTAIRNRRRRCGGGRAGPRRRRRDRRRTSGTRSSVDLDRRGARRGHARGVDQQAVGDVHHRADDRRQPLRRPPAAAAGCGSARSAAVGAASSPRSACSPAPASPIVPLTQSWSPGRAPARERHRPVARPIAVRPSTRAGAETVSPPSSGMPNARERRGEAVERRPGPSRVAEGEAEQHAQRPRALGGEIGEIHRDQLPGDVAGGSSGRIMDALDDHVVGEDQGLAADLQHRGIVDQPPRRRIGGKARASESMKADSALTAHLPRQRVEQAVDEACLARVVKGFGDVDIFVDHGAAGRRGGRPTRRRRRARSPSSACRAGPASSRRSAGRDQRVELLAAGIGAAHQIVEEIDLGLGIFDAVDRGAEPMLVEFVEQRRRSGSPPSPAGRAPARRRAGRRSASGSVWGWWPWGAAIAATGANPSPQPA